MRNNVHLFLILFINLSGNAQKIYGDWVKTKVEYIDSSELPNENELKYHYLRYTFESSDKYFMSLSFDNKGTALLFALNKNVLEIKNSFGYTTNSFLVSKLTRDELVLIQRGRTSFSDKDCIRLYFIKESVFQKMLPVRPSDILFINKGDTVYKACEKICAKFQGNKSFYDFCPENIPEKKAVSATNSFFLATFIVRKTGIIDDVRILENINERFEKQFREALQKSRRFWAAAELNGRKVDVQIEQSFKFVSSGKFLPMYDFDQKGKMAMKSSDYNAALYYFDLALENSPEDYSILYNRAICELNLGNKSAACEDLKKVKGSGMNVDELIDKECK